MKTLVGALALSLAAQGAALAQTPVTLTPVGKTSPAASVTLSQQGANLLISLSLPQGYQPARAAIFSGTCDAGASGASMSGDEPISLNINATGGAATTTLTGVTLKDFTAKPHVIVVLGTPALCGDLK